MIRLLPRFDMPFLRPIAETSGDAGSYEDGTEDAEGDDGGDSPAVVPFFQFSRFGRRWRGG